MPNLTIKSPTDQPTLAVPGNTEIKSAISAATNDAVKKIDTITANPGRTEVTVSYTMSAGATLNPGTFKQKLQGLVRANWQVS